MVDLNLISSCMEKWHIKISLFHMSFGEMTITHLTIKNDFHDHPPDINEKDVVALIELLRVTI